MQPRMIIEQKITLLANQYRIYSADANGQKQQLIAFAQQKRLALKEKIEFYSDESKQQKIFQFRAEKVLDIHGRFLVEDPANQLIGAFKKDFGQSLAVSTWHILGQNDQPMYTVAENNVTVAVLRRFIGEIPLIGMFAEIAMAFVKYHFAFKPYGGSDVQGMYQKTTLFRDHYLFSATDQLTQVVDWRVLVSMSVALDALQSR